MTRLFKIIRTGESNPFLTGSEGRKEWNDRFLSLDRSRKHWQLAFFASMLIVLFLSSGIAWLALSSKVQAFVVETNHGMPYYMGPLKSKYEKDQRLINFAVNQFIINARSVITDPEAEKALLNKVYAYSANRAITFLHDFFQNNNPFDRAVQTTVSVQIINSLPISKDTWQIIWDEEKRNLNGINDVQVTRWIAHLNYKFGEINQSFITENPFGLYITDISWSRSNKF